MLKKCGIALALLIIIGSMGYAVGQSSDGRAFMEKPQKHMVVILDLSGGEGQPWTIGHPQGLHIVRDADGAYIPGKMIVREEGSGLQQTLPVRLYRHGPMPGKPFLESYRMSATYAQNGSNFTIDGELIVNGSEGYDNVITMGQAVWHQAQVYPGTSLNVDLKWNNTADDLRLMIYTPDGHVLGPYYDGSDGRADGRISLEVDNPAGVAAGSWSFKVMGISVAGKDEYYLKVW